MKQRAERATVHCQITPAQESVPQRGQVLQGRGLTNWHLMVLRVIATQPANDNGTVEVTMRVQRTDIGRHQQPCPICGADWMTVQEGEPHEETNDG